MTQEPSYLKNLRALTRTAPGLEHLEALAQELYVTGSDRATAILFGSFVESSLEYLVASVMRKDLNSTERRRMFEAEGPAGTFSSKIIMAYALGLIGPTTRSDLNLIRNLRNEFAHSKMPFDFNTPEVGAVTDQLKIVDLPGSTIPYEYLNRVSRKNLSIAIDKTKPKTRFISTCHNLSYRMIVKTRGPQAGDFVFPNDNPVP